jgi:EAL domain-containing protein (putative c-di-GMP-specific phosphodiesterase class I)
LLAKHTLSPNYIELEITEAALMDQSGHMIDIMKKFKRLGFEFAIDDFGTGYSSLTYLSKFPIDTLKIDMSFIRNLEFSDSQRSIVKTIINLGDNLGLKVIAEGVETRAQYDILARLGCDSIQGYILSRPLDARDVDTFIVNNNYTNVAPLFQSDTKVT